jgi:hypothetical protein|tara:strand:+ start:1821 stop:2156 length:336 start_codon:yes stop_codon:yes gene_type:complete
MSFKNAIPDVIDYCRTELDIPDDILISVEYEDLSDEGVKGWAIDSAEDDEYDIEVDHNLTPDEAILTVCHEMVHISQMHKGHGLDEVEATEKEQTLFDGYWQWQAYLNEIT